MLLLLNGLLKLIRWAFPLLGLNNQLTFTSWLGAAHSSFETPCIQEYDWHCFPRHPWSQDTISQADSSSHHRFLQAKPDKSLEASAGMCNKYSYFTLLISNLYLMTRAILLRVVSTWHVTHGKHPTSMVILQSQDHGLRRMCQTFGKLRQHYLGLFVSTMHTMVDALARPFSRLSNGLVL